jgi:hypothetical protein
VRLVGPPQRSVGLVERPSGITEIARVGGGEIRNSEGLNSLGHLNFFLPFLLFLLFSSLSTAYRIVDPGSDESSEPIADLICRSICAARKDRERFTSCAMWWKTVIMEYSEGWWIYSQTEIHSDAPGISYNVFVTVGAMKKLTTREVAQNVFHLRDRASCNNVTTSSPIASRSTLLARAQA